MRDLIKDTSDCGECRLFRTFVLALPFAENNSQKLKNVLIVHGICVIKRNLFLILPCTQWFFLGGNDYITGTTKAKCNRTQRLLEMCWNVLKHAWLNNKETPQVPRKRNAYISMIKSSFSLHWNGGIIIYRDLEIVTSIQRPETWDFKDDISRFLTISERWFWSLF